MSLGLVGGPLGFITGVAVDGLIGDSWLGAPEGWDGGAPPLGRPVRRLFGRKRAPSPPPRLVTVVGDGRSLPSNDVPVRSLLLLGAPLLPLSFWPTVILISVTMSPGLIASRRRVEPACCCCCNCRASDVG